MCLACQCSQAWPLRSIIAPEDAELVHTRSEEIYNAFKPYTDYQAWQVDRAAILTIRIERAERMERRTRDKICLRAELTWDDDRRLEAEVLGGMLPKKPAETIEMLRRTPHGCEWLMTRWALLAYAADNQPEHLWTDEQTSMAFDLLATPPAFRIGHKPGASIDFHGKVLDTADDSAAVARRMVDELMERREVVRGLDEVDRALTEADLDHDTNPELRRLRRLRQIGGTAQPAPLDDQAAHVPRAARNPRPGPAPGLESGRGPGGSPRAEASGREGGRGSRPDPVQPAILPDARRVPASRTKGRRAGDREVPQEEASGEGPGASRGQSPQGEGSPRLNRR